MALDHRRNDNHTLYRDIGYRGISYRYSTTAHQLASRRMIVDSPIHRTEYHELTHEHQLALIEQLRERRLNAVRVYELLQHKKDETRLVKAKIKAGKMLIKMNKALTAAEKYTTDAESLIHACKALLLEIGDD